MRARSAGEKRSPNAHSRLPNAAARPRRSTRYASVPSARASRRQLRRESRGINHASSRHAANSTRYRRYFQRLSGRGSEGGEVVDTAEETIRQSDDRTIRTRDIATDFQHVERNEPV